MIKKVISTIEKYNMLKDGDKVIVGVSGGPDSITLLHVLKNLQCVYNLEIYAVHINHRLRGKESDQDQEYVENICREWDVPLFVESIDIYKLSKEQKASLEVVGREIRYKTFNRILNQLGAQKIAVAHNANDNAETVLMKIIRGTGLEGLTGIKAVRGNIIRPLINIQREEIEQYCKDNNLRPRTDSSNLERIFTRNKIRLELIPFLKKEFNPNIISTINRMSRIIALENEYINESASNILNHVIMDQSKEYININLDKIKKQPFFIIPRVIRRAIEKLTGNLEGISSTNIDNAINFIYNANSGSILDLPKGLKLKKSYNQLIISKAGQMTDNKKYNYNIPIPGNLIIKETGDILEVELADISDSIETNTFTKKFDFDKIKGNLNLRTRQNGDVFNPSGMRGTKKLKDYFIDKKIPREERDKIPLVALGKDIIWIIGYRTSERYKVDEKTKKILVLKYIKNNQS